MKKLYAQNDATVPQLSYKYYSWFQTLLFVNYHINFKGPKTWYINEYT